eukprot:885713_1
MAKSQQFSPQKNEQFVQSHTPDKFSWNFNSTDINDLDNNMFDCKWGDEITNTNDNNTNQTPELIYNNTRNKCYFSWNMSDTNHDNDVSTWQYDAPPISDDVSKIFVSNRKPKRLLKSLFTTQKPKFIIAQHTQHRNT